MGALHWFESCDIAFRKLKLQEECIKDAVIYLTASLKMQLVDGYKNITLIEWDRVIERYLLNYTRTLLLYFI